MIASNGNRCTQHWNVETLKYKIQFNFIVEREKRISPVRENNANENEFVHVNNNNIVNGRTKKKMINNNNYLYDL